jgi:uncharacterized DUF497 family protein
VTAGEIEWDAMKEAANIARRGIAFGEAATALLDVDVIIRVDREHGQEDRLVSVGFSRRGRLLTVVTAERPRVGSGSSPHGAPRSANEMPTNDTPSDSERIAAFRASLRSPVGISIAGASAYWLETPRQEMLGPESRTSREPLERARIEIRDGRDPEGLRLACRLSSGERHVVAAGSVLAELAEWAAGIATSRRRVARDAATA